MPTILASLAQSCIFYHVVLSKIQSAVNPFFFHFHLQLKHIHIVILLHIVSESSALIVANSALIITSSALIVAHSALLITDVL